MKRNFYTRRLIISVAVLFAAAVVFTTESSAQRRDYMTTDEIELVRENQALDTRVAVIVKMIDRRFRAMGTDVGGSKPRSDEVWGPEPTGTTVELYSDINRLLEKAIEDVEGVVERGHGQFVPEKNRDRIIPRAMDELTKAARRYLPVLKAAGEKTRDEKEFGAIAGAVEYCEMILEAAAKK